MTWRTSMKIQHRSGFVFFLLLALLQQGADGWGATSGGQASVVLYEETFDTVLPPALPPGWWSSSSRLAGTADLVTAASSPASPPQAIAGSNAAVEQWLVSRSFDPRAVFPALLSFSLRRSSTFAARCIVEASTDGGRTFGVVIGEAPSIFPSSVYEKLEFPLPPSLAAADSFVLRWHFLPAATGTTATVRIDDVRLTRPRPPVPRGMVVINEIQCQPPAAQPEWIELMNTGSAEVEIAGWRVLDSPTGTAHAVSAATAPLPSGALVVLAADSAAVRAAVGPAAMIVQTSGFPSLNNAGDLVLVQDEEGATMDSVRYDDASGGGPGVSIERIDPRSASSIAGNWGGCRDTMGSTPGRENSIIIRPFDLRMARVVMHTDPGTGTTGFLATVRNAGSAVAPPCRIEVFSDVSGMEADPLASGMMEAPLAAGDSTDVICPWRDQLPGRWRIRAAVVWENDQRPENNFIIGDVVTPVAAGILRINEIQAAPLGGTAEFIEIINVSSSPVSLEGCFLADRHVGVPSMHRWTVTDRRRVLPGSAMHVVAGDSTVGIAARLAAEICTTVSGTGLGLNNDGDTVLLYSADSVLIDSVAYAPSWHSATVDDPAGRSLERYDPRLASGDARNWGTCVDPSGGTAGRANSILITPSVSAASLVCAPDPFSPDADGRDDVTVVRYRLPARSSLIRIRVYDIRGRQVRDLVNAAPAAMTGEVVWDGMGEGRTPLRIGIYIIHLEGIDEEGGRMLTAACAVVLARRL